MNLPRMTRLTERDESTVLNALRVAAERFDEHAAEFRKQAAAATHTGQVRGFERTAEQFDKQARESRELADRIEESGICG